LKLGGNFHPVLNGTVKIWGTKFWNWVKNLLNPKPKHDPNNMVPIWGCELPGFETRENLASSFETGMFTIWDPAYMVFFVGVLQLNIGLSGVHAHCVPYLVLQS
jgi:hypothetical protein